MPKQEHEGITVDGKPLTTYLEKEERNVIEEVRVKDVLDAFCGHMPPTSNYTSANLSRSRSQHRDTVKTYSSEVLAHLNYLRESQGEKAVTEFLNTPQNGNHSIETVVKDAEDKIRFYTRQASDAQVQVVKWSAVKQQLQSALDTLSGKTPASASAELNSSAPRKQWKEIVKQYLLEGKRTKSELFDFISANGGTQNQRYNMVSTYRSRGLIEISDTNEVSWLGE